MANKYHARKVTVDGITFDSLSEARRYGELRLLERAGEIQDLKVHVKFPLEVNDQLICSYVADFVYLQLHPRRAVFEDVKGGRTGGTRTAVYRLKRKLFKAIYGLDITEVEA